LKVQGKVVRRGRKGKLPPITQEERDRLVQEFMDGGGRVMTVPTGEMAGGLAYGKRGSTVEKQVPWLGETVQAIRREDADLTSDISFD
jgi:hypothetical protein